MSLLFSGRVLPLFDFAPANTFLAKESNEASVSNMLRHNLLVTSLKIVEPIESSKSNQIRLQTHNNREFNINNHNTAYEPSMKMFG